MSIDQLISATDPLAVRLMSQLDVLHTWTGMYGRIIERFESRSYDNFDVLIRSDDLASVFVYIIALTANQNNASHQQSIISFSGH